LILMAVLFGTPENIWAVQVLHLQEQESTLFN